MSFSKPSTSSQKNLTGPNPPAGHTYEFEDFRLDAAHSMLYRNGVVVSLKPKVVETLVALVERGGSLVSKEELMDRVWGDAFVEESNLTQNIYLLRKSLGNCADGQPFIENFARRGYRFNGTLKSSSDLELVLATHTSTTTVVEETVANDRGRPSWLVPALAGVVLLGGLAFAVMRFVPDQKAESAVEPFQAFSLKRYPDSNEVTSGVISHDGKFIAYTSKQNAMWLKNTVTGDAIKILEESPDIERSVIAFSPDDNHIYFFNLAKNKKSSVARISVVGGAVERTMVEDSWSGVALSPDGTQFAFIRNDDGSAKQALIIANADGSGERKAAVSPEGKWFGLWSHSTTWSPDGTQVAVAGGTHLDGRSTWDIKIFRAADGEEISTVKPEADWRWIDAVLWLPDGKDLLVIGGDNTSQGQIYKLTLATGAWHLVTNDLGNYTALSVTADGKTVVTVEHENSGNLWLVPSDGDTSKATQITSGRNLMTDVTGVSWTPDGKIVYATNAAGKWEIRITDADGANQQQLIQNCAGNDTCSQPVVSPDGRYIVFHANRGGVRNIWRMEIDGGNPTQLTDAGGFGPSVTPDGRFVVFTRSTPVQTLWKVPIDGGESEQFNTIPSVDSSSFSPDGKQIAFSYYDKTSKQPFQTCVAPVGASAPEKCFGISRSFPRWAADGKAFYYLDHGYRGIWKQPLDGERTLFLEFPGERTNNFAFSPDGKHLVVARSKATQDLVALTDLK